MHLNRVQKIVSHLSPHNCATKYERLGELTIWDATNLNTILYKQTYFDTDKIKSELNNRGIGYEVWTLKNMKETASNDEILKIYDEEIQTIMKQHNFQTYDIVNVT
eukprot:767485_1